MFPCSQLQATEMHQASAACGEEGGSRRLAEGAVPWESPVDEPFSSGKDASSQQLCTACCLSLHSHQHPQCPRFKHLQKTLVFEARQIPMSVVLALCGLLGGTAKLFADVLTPWER